MLKPDLLNDADIDDSKILFKLRLNPISIEVKQVISVHWRVRFGMFIESGCTRNRREPYDVVSCGAKNAYDFPQGLIKRENMVQGGSGNNCIELLVLPRNEFVESLRNFKSGMVGNRKRLETVESLALMAGEISWFTMRAAANIQDVAVSEYIHICTK
jgi:hypothetical protein